jgi:hypothetical protein
MVSSCRPCSSSYCSLPSFCLLLFYPLPQLLLPTLSYLFPNLPLTSLISVFPILIIPSYLDSFHHSLPKYSFPHSLFSILPSFPSDYYFYPTVDCYRTLSRYTSCSLSPSSCPPNPFSFPHSHFSCPLSPSLCPFSALYLDL